ncbi:MAG: phosphoglucomutase/phosphomannomutase family protein [Elusimicrobia bacterium]|nr:phosphoglucomutase/phosphomannomutase family protein [Elusimicrobiota bacterium]MDE2314482.1 phosphoglucomutase/phosphomannomutase family protein [Elusimicrobiota bacterium]
MLKFGTSGWRAVISEEFTFQNVRRVAHAIAGFVKENPETGILSPDYQSHIKGEPPVVPEVVVGYDTRFLSHEFAQELAGVLAMSGVKSYFSQEEVPTPALAWAVLERKAVGGAMITASHNGPYYNGVKWMPYWGGAATPAVTDDLERRIEFLGEQSPRIMAWDKAVRESLVEPQEFRKGYLRKISSLLDLKAIKNARLKVGVDSLHGAGRHYLGPFLESLGVEVVEINTNRDVLFGGRSPEPTEESLQDLAAVMRKKKLSLGLAMDGDADRFGILDAGGTWIGPNDVLALALEHLVAHKGMKGKVARTVMTSHFVDAVAKSYGLETRETPVGFKYIGELLRTGHFILGGEESGGLSIQGHVPEKDGILACLLMVELVAREKKPLSAVRDRLFKRVGHFCSARINFRIEKLRQMIEVQERLRVKPPLDLAGGSVWRIDESDGFKFILRDGSWLGLRPSGTESAVRVYAEASTPKALGGLMEAGKKLLQGKF